MTDPVSLLSESTPTLSTTSQVEADHEVGQKNYISLLRYGIIYILAVKIDNCTGGKVACFRNWKESSGQALFVAIKMVYGQEIVDSTLETTRGKVNPVLASTQKWLGSKGETFKKLTREAGIDQSVKVCRKFVEVSCFLLEQGEAGTTQNIDRLLTIVGVAYSGNENVKAIVDSVLESYSKNFFEEVLPKMIRDFCGVFGGPVEKLVVTLGVKDIVDNFLKEHILKDQSVEKVLKKGDVYQKLILVGVAKFIDIKDQRVQDLKVQDLLTDEKLDKRVRIQLKRLLKYYGDSKLAQLGTEAGHSLIKRTLERLKDKNIGEISSEELKEVLFDAVTFEGAYGAASRVVEVTSVVTGIGDFVKDTYVWKKFTGTVRWIKSCLWETEAEKELETEVKKKLEDDFGEYLQKLFDPRVVEQKEEESTGVVSTLVERGWNLGKAGVKGAWNVGKAVGKGAWWLGKSLFSAAYNCATGSSTESESNQAKEGKVPESQTAREQNKDTTPKQANPMS